MNLLLQCDKNDATLFGNLGVGPITFTGTIDPLVAYVTLASGDNTVTVPADAAGVVIAPPDDNTLLLTYRTENGDDGVNIPKATPSVFVFDLDELPDSIILNAEDDVSGAAQIVFF